MIKGKPKKLCLIGTNRPVSYKVNDLVMIKNRKLSSKAKEYTASLDSVWKGSICH